MKSNPTRQPLLDSTPDSTQHSLARFILNNGGPITSDSEGAIASTPLNDLLAQPDLVPTLQKLLGIEGDPADLHVTEAPRPQKRPRTLTKFLSIVYFRKSLYTSNL